ncbi:MAG TPA: NADH:flavin oxidoreductase/NADH oxidase [Intrasporangium sp.]|uniref:NADH:flavin oxidoreductase/NADH oxidase n=1 Tax=Intrasporangium sp. TaxID=1925024 RepID=UPI002D764BD0|nr:NADH:flavin oxidoreductase/NADH oxidase [Intrasporangium sp.]HET7399067.1 NADH:flavin oxidoreductase/NADH oxidase [Intrasporangium sp.]
MTSLFDRVPLRAEDAGSVTARNRLWISPMCQYSVFAEDGIPTDWHFVHLGQFAIGGAGVVFTEATAVSPEGRISARDTGIWTDEQASAWSRVAAFVRSHGAVPGIQLAHAGRKASTYAPWGMDRRGTVPADAGGWEAVAPSPVAFGRYAVPTALDERGIERVVADFGAAAERAVQAGFEVIEIHAAHGYLMHQFLSGLANTRTDDYGGTLENRARLLLRVVDAVRRAAGDRAVFVRLSGTDWAPPELADRAWEQEQCATVAGWVAQAGADFLDVSTGGILPAPDIPVGPGYQVPFAAHVRRTAGVRVSTVGLITEAAQADAVIRTGKADAVMVARAALRDPHVALRMAGELGVELDYVPGQYLRAY